MTSASVLVDLREVAGLPDAYIPVRGGADDADERVAEEALEAAFAIAPADAWVERLRGLGLPVEPIADVNRDTFRRGILDEPVNRELGRAVAYETADWCHFEQIGPLLRTGPAASTGPLLELPGIGEHSVEILHELGVPDDEIDALLVAGTVRQLGHGD